MKKKLSVFTAVTMLMSAFTAFNAEAASLTMGIRQDFESAVPTDRYVEGSTAEKYGGVLKFTSDENNSGGQMVFDLDSGATNGEYLLSFDAMMSSTSANLFVWTNVYDKNNSAWQQKGFMALAEGGRVTTFNADAWSFSQIGAASFKPNVWQRYDILLDFDVDDTTSTKWGEVYIDGVLQGEINLTANGINAMNKVHFVFADYKKSGAYAMLDNLEFKKYIGAAEMSAKRNLRGEFEAEFSETMSGISESDFVLTRDSLDTEETETEAVGFSIAYSTPTKAVIIPDNKDLGYTYTLSVANGKRSALGNPVTGTYSVKLGKAAAIDSEWNFEDGNNPIGGNTEIADIANRGKVLKFTGSQDANFRIGSTLGSGKYIYSYDLMREDKSDANYMLIRTYNGSSVWNCFEGFWDTKQFGNFGTSQDPKRGWGLTQLGGKVMEDGIWYRVDNIMDMDSKTAFVYCDGEYLGSIDLEEKGLSEFTGAMMSVVGKNGYYDNIRVRTVSDSYGAKLTADGARLYIDFDETTTGLTNESFIVTKSTGLFAGEETLSSQLIYQNGARAVLMLGEDITDGNIYTVKFNNVTSFMGNPIAASVTLDKSCSEEEKNDAVVNDDMSSYTADNILAEGSPWKINKNADRIMVEDGAVTLAQSNSESRLEYYFDEVSGGVIEMEVTLNAQSKTEGDSAREYIYVSFGDGDNEGFFLTQFNSAYGLVAPTSSSASSNVYVWNQTSYTQGTDVTIKYVYDFKTRMATIYKNGERFAYNAYPWGTDKHYAQDITGIKSLKFHPLNASVSIKNVKVTHKYVSAAADKIYFTDVNGNNYSAGNVSAKANQMKISYPKGMADGKFNGMVEVTCGGEKVNGSGEWNNAEKVYTITFDKLLGEGKTYNVKISGSVGASGESYQDVSGSFTTLNDGAFEIATPDFEKTSDGIDVTLNCINNKETKTYYIIYAAYNGNEMAAMDYKPLTLEKDAAPQKLISFRDADAASHERISVLIWENFESMTPATEVVTK